MSKKLNRVISFALTFLILFTSFTAAVSAADAKAVLEFRLSDDGYAIVSECDTDASGVVSIPTKAEIKNKSYSVKYIGDRAFNKCKYVTEIRIPEGVTAIGSAAFRDCTALKEVHIPETLLRCEFDAFDGCKDVTVHCYSANYQFIMLCGSYTNIVIDIIDEQDFDDSAIDDSDGLNLEEFGFIGTFITALREMIQSIFDYFGVQDNEFSVEDLPFDFPFEIPEEENSVLGELIGVDL